MTEPKTYTLDAPGAVLHYDVRSPSRDAATAVITAPPARRHRTSTRTTCTG